MIFVYIYIYIYLSLYHFIFSSIRWRLFNRNWIFAFADFVILSNLFNIQSPGGDVRSAWPVPDFLSFFPTGFFGAGFSGHPGTLTCSFSLITFAVTMFIF